MLKRAILLAAVLTLLVVFPAAAQQPDDWSAYLYDSGTRQLTRVYLDGRQQAYDPGLPPDAALMQDTIDFTSDGNHAAYCVIDSGGNASLNLWDIANSTFKQ